MIKRANISSFCVIMNIGGFKMSDINKLLEEIPKEEIIKYLNNNGIKVVIK